MDFIEVSAKTVLEHNNVFDVSIGTVRGFFTDFFEAQTSIVLQIKRISLIEYIFHRIK